MGWENWGLTFNVEDEEDNESESLHGIRAMCLRDVVIDRWAESVLFLRLA